MTPEKLKTLLEHILRMSFSPKESICFLEEHGGTRSGFETGFEPRNFFEKFFKKVLTFFFRLYIIIIERGKKGGILE